MMMEPGSACKAEIGAERKKQMTGRSPLARLARVGKSTVKPKGIGLMEGAQVVLG